MKYLYYVKPEVPKKNWTYDIGTVIAESDTEAIQKGNESFGTECYILKGPYPLSEYWNS